MLLPGSPRTKGRGPSTRMSKSYPSSTLYYSMTTSEDFAANSMNPKAGCGDSKWAGVVRESFFVGIQTWDMSAHRSGELAAPSRHPSLTTERTKRNHCRRAALVVRAPDRSAGSSCARRSKRLRGSRRARRSCTPRRTVAGRPSARRSAISRLSMSRRKRSSIAKPSVSSIQWQYSRSWLATRFSKRGPLCA